MQTKCALFACTLLALLASPVPSEAGPDATANRFLTDSPSMMDWGSFRLEQHLAEQPELNRPTVTYNWDKNRILVKGVQIAAEDTTPENAEQRCRDWFAAARGMAWIDSTSGKLWFPENRNSAFASFYGHTGFRREIGGVKEEDALPELDKLFELEFTFYQRQEDGTLTQNLRCIGPLLGSTVAFER